MYCTHYYDAKQVAYGKRLIHLIKHKISTFLSLMVLLKGGGWFFGASSEVLVSAVLFQDECNTFCGGTGQPHSLLLTRRPAFFGNSCEKQYFTWI